MTNSQNPGRSNSIGSINEHRVVWLSIATAADRVGNSPRTIKRWISAGLLAATRLSACTSRITISRPKSCATCVRPIARPSSMKSR
jgi:hypothetical protein